MKFASRLVSFDPAPVDRFRPISTSICLPGAMSHASVPSELRALLNLPPDLVRLSVGIEDEDDLIADLDRAIRRAKPHTSIAAGL